ncbi:hypothetical protein VRB15_06090 [Pseudomonas poae]|uniref:hypothetical protein n=1 Tax=Pseudomonas poae TaxID=200451 RepID=UPI0030CB4B73
MTHEKSPDSVRAFSCSTKCLASSPDHLVTDAAYRRTAGVLRERHRRIFVAVIDVDIDIQLVVALAFILVMAMFLVLVAAVPPNIAFNSGISIGTGIGKIINIPSH